VIALFHFDETSQRFHSSLDIFLYPVEELSVEQAECAHLTMFLAPFFDSEGSRGDAFCVHQAAFHSFQLSCRDEMIFLSADEKYGAADFSRDVPDIEFRHDGGNINGIVHTQGPLRVVDAPSHRRIRAHFEPDQRARDSPKSLVCEELHESGYFAPHRFSEVKHYVERDDPIDTVIEGSRPGGKVQEWCGRVSCVPLVAESL